jgi:hypothetical protein
MITVYKVLDTTYGGLRSLGTVPPHELIYEPGVVKQYPNMFVYESEEAARAGGVGWRHIVLWECETTQTRPAPELIVKAHYLNQCFNAYWEAGGDHKGLEGWPGWLNHMLKTPPDGTVLVDDLKLIRPLA